jgi:sulfotransferase family protein
MLVASNEVLPSDEPNIGLQLAPFASDRPGMRAADFDDGNCTAYRFGRGYPGYFFSDSHRAEWCGPLRDLICERYAFARDWKLVAIKEPHGSQAADLISLVLPQSRFLFLLRDGRDVVDSQLAGLLPGGWLIREYGLSALAPDERRGFIESVARQWVWRTRIVQAAFDDHGGPKLRIRYEDLRRDTGSELAGVFEWLGLTADAASIAQAHAYDRVEARGPAERVRSARAGTWRENLDSGEQELLTEIMGPTLREVGYSA